MVGISREQAQQAKAEAQAKPYTLQPEPRDKASFPSLVTAEDFIAGYAPKTPVIKALDMKPGWLYSLTAPTGGAKTAVTLCESMQLARDGLRVVYLAGENADDVRARVILMQYMLGIYPLPPTLRFVDRTFNLHEGMDHTRKEVADLGGADLIVVDTSPAFQNASGGQEENSNDEAIRWARRLRELTRLEGLPAVWALCHPIKWPQGVEHCLPRGGGGFLAEVDGNYTLWPVADNGKEKFVELSWIGKFRGYFEPFTYVVSVATCGRLSDQDGNPVYSVWAHRADESQIDRAAADQTEDQNAVLMVMKDYPGRSMAEWARLLDWSIPSGPAKYRVDRCIKHLVKHKLAKSGRRGRYELTERGKKEAEHVAKEIKKDAE